MNKCEIIERPKNIAGYAVHTVGEEPFVMSLDDGIAVREAIELLEKPETNCSEFPNNSDTIYRQQAIDFVGSMNMCDEISNEAYKKLTSYLDELPSAEPYTTTHDSIPAETGKNDGDGTSGDCISRQAVTKFLNDWLSCLFENCHKQSASDLKMIIKDFKNLPSVQPDDDRLERCRFEYINACKILAHRTPDTRKKDIDDAYAVVRALNPIFGEEGF